MDKIFYNETNDNISTYNELIFPFPRFYHPFALNTAPFFWFCRLLNGVASAYMP